MNCINCGNVLTKRHQKKFCSSACAAKVNNKNRKVSEEQKEKVSISLKNHYKINKPRSSGLEHAKLVGASTKGKYKKEVNSILEASTRTVAKIVKRLQLKCCICGWDEESIDIHHIIPRRMGGTDLHDNLTPLCPNHHRLADRQKINSDKFVTLTTLLGPNWKDLYFG